MKTAIWYRAFFVGLVGSAFIVSGAFAQERVIEEEILLKDPTVAAKGKFLVGGSAEIWYLTGDFDTFSGGEKIAEGSIDGAIPGGSIYLGYGDLTFLGSYKEGDFDIDRNFIGTPFRTEANIDQTTLELKARWMFRDTNILGVVPYVMVGYNRTELDSDERCVTPVNCIFVQTGTANFRDETEYDSALVGVGGVLPFGDTGLGLRGDASATLTWSEETLLNPAPGVDATGEGFGVGAIAHLTGYWTIYKGLNVQAGAKGTFLNGGGDVGSYGRVGFFAQVGYTHRF